MRSGALALLSWLVVACTTGGAGGSVPTTTVAPEAALTTTLSTTVTTLQATTTPPATSTPSPTTTLPATTTTVESVTSTTVEAAAVPPLRNRGEDFDRITRSLNDFGGWLYEHPNPDLVELTSVPGSPDYEWFQPIIDEYAREGWRDLPGGRSRVVEVEVAQHDGSGNRALVAVLSEYEGSTTVDGEGNVVKEEEGREPTWHLWDLRFSPRHGWRVFEITFLTEGEGV